MICDSCGKEIKYTTDYDQSYRNHNDLFYEHLCTKCQAKREREFENKFEEIQKSYGDLKRRFEKLQKKYKELRDIKKQEICNKITVG